MIYSIFLNKISELNLKKNKSVKKIPAGLAKEMTE